MTTPLKPGDPVLVEARVEGTTPEGAVIFDGCDYCTKWPDRVHPLPTPVWVVDAGGWIVIYESDPSGITSSLQLRAIKICEIGHNKFRRLFGDKNTPEPNQCLCVHLLAIPAKEGE